jgi:Putative Flp pilus-assembly TadE/G-like
VNASTPGHLERRDQRGQALPLFALFLIVLLGFSALAIDVTGVYSAKRFYRSVADASSLAGAQDLQQGTTRTVTNTERTRARTDAMDRLISLLGSSTPSCPPTADIIDCALPGTAFLVSIKTPSPSCVACDPNRSVQVTVRNPTYGLSFARIFGQANWNVGSTSVAGLTYGKSYTIVTLRPPKKLGSTFDVKDITLDGGTVVTVSIGDVGSNANMNYSGTGSLLVLNSDYGMFYFDPLSGPLWSPSPVGQKITQLITDPNYQYPSMAGAPTWADARESQANAVGSPATTANVDSACATEWAKVDPLRYVSIASTPLSKVYCYKPGIYDGTNRAQLVASTGNVALLMPGAYYLKKGLDVSGSLVGGYEPGAPGVALMFDECQNTCTFNGNNAVVIALNAGTKFPATYLGGTGALAAIDWAGNPVQTSGSSSPTPPVLMSVLVKKDPTCFVPTSPPYIEPAGCDALKDKTMNIAGTGSLVLEGVQYMPTDNVEISGNSSSNGRVGQIISWTLKYSGGVAINQEGVDQGGPGVLRLDAACTTPSTVCNNP